MELTVDIVLVSDRSCPGRHIADRNGLALAASVLSAYDIVPLEGEGLPTHVEFTKGQIR